MIGGQYNEDDISRLWRDKNKFEARKRYMEDISTKMASEYVKIKETEEGEVTTCPVEEQMEEDAHQSKS